MRRILPLLLLAGILAAADGDVVVLDNRQRIAGTLEDDPTSPDHVLIRDGKGVMRIRRNRVASFQPGPATRLAAVKDDDLPGLIALAHWCRAKGQRAEARQALDRARRLPGFPLEEAGAYAALVDELDGPEAALPLYVWYRNQGGKAPRLLARIRDLAAAGADLGGAGTAPAVAVARTAAAATVPARPLAAGLERRGWVAETAQYANPSEVRTITVDEDAGFGGKRPVLEIEGRAGTRDKVAIRRLVSYAVAPSAAKLAFQCANRGEHPVRIAIGIKTGSWTYFESSPTVMAPGTVEALRFDLLAAAFKTEASGWSYTSKVEGLDEVRELQVLIYTQNRPCRVQIAGMAFVGEQEL